MLWCHCYGVISKDYLLYARCFLQSIEMCAALTSSLVVFGYGVEEGENIFLEIGCKDSVISQDLCSFSSL